MTRATDTFKQIRARTEAEKETQATSDAALVLYSSGRASTPGKQSVGHHSGRNYKLSRVDLEPELAEELLQRRTDTPDLVEHQFGSIISQKLAEQIMMYLLGAGTLKVTGPDGEKEGDDFYASACRDALKTTKQQRDPVYTWTWVGINTGTEKDTVKFLNTVGCAAFKAVHALGKADEINDRTPRFRFSYMVDPNRPLPLSERSENIDLRPDLLLLPCEAWIHVVPSRSASHYFYFDPPDHLEERSAPTTAYSQWFSGQHLRDHLSLEYLNWSSSVMAGETKATDFANAIRQEYLYMRNMRRAQPWLQFVLGLAITKSHTAFLRADASGTEERRLSHASSRGVLDMIRLTLGLMLSTDTQLGYDPQFILTSQVVVRQQLDNNTPPQQTTTGEQYSGDIGAKRTANTALDTRPSKKPKPILPTRDRERIIIQILCGEDVYDVDFLVFNSDSLCGRCTRVWRVRSDKYPTQYLALKLSWLVSERIEKVLDVLPKLGKVEHFLHHLDHWVNPGNVMVSIRGITDDVPVFLAKENRQEMGTITPFKPTLHQFQSLEHIVQALINVLQAIISLEADCRLLHRDVSFDNILFTHDATPDDRGWYGLLADPDMMGDVVESQQDQTKSLITRTKKISSHTGKPSHHSKDREKAARTGTSPYIAIGILNGSEVHQAAHDVESVFYVLYLFFFTFNGSSATQFPNEPTRNRCHWPPAIQKWAYQGNWEELSERKQVFFAKRGKVLSALKESKASYWVDDEYRYWQVEALVLCAWHVFYNMADKGDFSLSPERQTQTRGQDFICALSYWLKWKENGAEDSFVPDGWQHEVSERSAT